MKSARKDLLDRLEVRRMESADYRAMWCLCCLRTVLRNPFVMLHLGDGGRCRKMMKAGTISECIADLRSHDDKPRDDGTAITPGEEPGS